MRQFLENIENAAGISIYPLFSLVLFSIMFLGVLIWVFTLDRKSVEIESNLPLDNNFNR